MFQGLTSYFKFSCNYVNHIISSFLMIFVNHISLINYLSSQFYFWKVTVDSNKAWYSTICACQWLCGFNSFTSKYLISSMCWWITGPDSWTRKFSFNYWHKRYNYIVSVYKYADPFPFVISHKICIGTEKHIFTIFCCLICVLQTSIGF